jgi:hypothetical protein
MLNEDYKDILQIFLDNKVQFLVVDAYAMGAYGWPRATGDIDLWVMASPDNSAKVYKSLAQFGAPMEQINEKTFCEQGIIRKIHMQWAKFLTQLPQLAQLSQIDIKIGVPDGASGVSFHHKTVHLADDCVSSAAAVSAIPS